MIDVEATLVRIHNAMVHGDATEARREMWEALAQSWEEGAANGDTVGMTAITLNPMHANPYRPTGEQT